MYERILAALDGSAASEAALPHALALARAFSAELCLLRVVPNVQAAPDAALLMGAEGVPAPGSLDMHSLATEEQEARQYLDELVAKHGDGLRLSTRIAFGPAPRGIAAAAEEWNADLLILTTHGRGGLARLMLGSVAEAVLRSVHCPTFVVPVQAAAREEAPERPTPGQVLSFEDDARQVGAVAPKPLGLRTVDVNRIVGSVGRARELGTDFRPPLRAQRRVDDQRFMNIVRALERGEVMPPIELYKLGYNYYVLDGNHRVAAARYINQKDIDAVVTEFLPVSNEEGATVFNERRDFERATGLTRIGASRVGHYPCLEAMVRAYAADPANKPSGYAAWRDGDLKEAARHWYYHVYEPVARAIRAARLSRCFPSERTADIFVHLANFRGEIRERTGMELSWEDAFRRFAEHYAGCAGTVWQRLPGLRKLLRPRVPPTPETR